VNVVLVLALWVVVLVGTVTSSSATTQPPGQLLLLSIVASMLNMKAYECEHGAACTLRPKTGPFPELASFFLLEGSYPRS
jgi:hypothetical protein